MVTVQILINNGHHDNDKRQDNAKSRQYKREFTHGSAKKKRGVGSCPYIIKITTRIILHEPYFIRSRCRSSQ
ncbi:hypothetical protein FZH48_16945 [Salmonella enterica]|uniref:Uncharacterized protein n=1 Tax=Salmonella enterica I TaxID=59201 RepID=A0A7Z1PI11_SALET|nr:hypothetical protein [Salmonella enterica]EBB5478094.1 hypothetical protein [Salmonella enterica]ECP3587464.1 hypothetical protein [Salmonella enterica]PTU35938.1 hypothetical protein DBZ43_16185 [Salmonella enterica subsp. enterica]